MFETIFYGTGFGRERMSAARAAYLFLVWVLVPGWLVMRFYALVVGLAFTGGFAMLAESIDADISFRRPFFTWTGDIGLEDLRVRPRVDDPDYPMSIDVRRLHIDMPNLGVMQRVLASVGTQDGSKEEAGLLAVVNRMDHVGIRVEGMKFDGIDALPGVLANIGVASAAPLEAEGCVGDALWLASELPALGIDNPGVDMEFTLASATGAREVRVTGKLASARSSRAQFAQHFKAANMAAFLDAPDGSRIATYERVEIDDEGFVAARDAYCGKRDGVDGAAFRERHLASVRRLLEARGLRAPAELEAVYRDYLDSGRLVLEARPNANIRREDYRHYSVADQAAMYNGTLAASGKAVPIRFEATPARALPESFEGSTWDLVALERRAAGAAGGVEATLAEVAPATAAPAPAPAAIPAPVPAAGRVRAAPAEVAIAAPVAATAATAAPKAATAATQAPAWALPPPSVRTTADGRPLASSLPPKGGQHRASLQSLGFSELSAHQGDRIILTTIHGDRHEGRIEGVVGSTLRLRSSGGLGYAITNFERAKIRSIISLE